MSDSKTFSCPVCGMIYDQEKWAEACEAWCREHNSCNLDIIKHAIDQKNSDQLHPEG